MARYRVVQSGMLVSGERAEADAVVEINGWTGVLKHGGWGHMAAVLKPVDDDAKDVLYTERVLKSRNAPMPATPADFDRDWANTPPRYRVTDDVKVDGVTHRRGETIELLTWPAHPARASLVPANTTAVEVVRWLEEGRANELTYGSVPWHADRVRLVGHAVCDGLSEF